MGRSVVHLPRQNEPGFAKTDVVTRRGYRNGSILALFFIVGDFVMRDLRNLGSVVRASVKATQAVAGRSAAAIALVAGLGAALAPSLIAPAPAQAYLAELGVSIDNGSSDSYSTLVRRAEQVARAAAQRTFDNDILVTEVSVTITGNYRGLEVPILTLPVGRYDWRAQPDTKEWATYYPGSKSLLGFEGTDSAF